MDPCNLLEVHQQQTSKKTYTQQLLYVQKEKSQGVIIGKNEILHLCKIMKRKYSY